MKVKLFALPNEKIGENQISGAGNKKILVVVKQSEAAEKTLSDLLKAIKLDQAHDILTLTTSTDSPLAISKLIAQHSMEKVLAFGFESADLGFNINQAYNHIYQFADFKLLLSESIAELNADKNKKIALWKSLQELFLK